MITRLKASWKALTAKPDHPRKEYATVVKSKNACYVMLRGEVYRFLAVNSCIYAARMAQKYGPDYFDRFTPSSDTPVKVEVVESFQI